MNYAIAIDGPAGAGKSTVAKKVAKNLGYIYVDTGAMFRALALYFIRSGYLADEKDRIIQSLDKISIAIEYQNGEQQVLLNDENVTPYLRSEQVSAMTSATSAYPQVRAKLLDFQRQLAQKDNVVMDGRDIGTKVLPNANLKIFLTASIDSRAKRRYLELKEKGEACSYDLIKRDIEERDDRDIHREEAPLVQASDAIYLDTSDMSIDEVVESIIQKMT